MWRKYKGFRTFLYQTRARLPIAHKNASFDTKLAFFLCTHKGCIALVIYGFLRKRRTTAI